MPRPPSIVLFERLYLGALALYLVNAAMFWSQTHAVVDQSAQVQANPGLAGMMGGIMVGALVVTSLVAVLLWYLVARQGSVVGKWLVVVTEAVGAVFGILAVSRLVRGDVPAPLNVTIGLLSTLLAVVAATLLFRPDTRPWFGDVVEEASPL